MTDGYQIIESEDLAKLVSKSAHLQFSVAVLSWVAAQLNMRAHGRLAGLEFSVIPVQYISRYPAVGVRYPDSGQEDREKDILLAISEILETTTLNVFVVHLCSQDSWGDIATNLLNE